MLRFQKHLAGFELLIVYELGVARQGYPDGALAALTNEPDCKTPPEKRTKGSHGGVLKC